MKRLILILTIFQFIFIFTSCSKYEEGSKFTILTKKQRMVNDWKIKTLTADGSDITTLNLVTELDIKDDGKIVIRGNFFGIPTTENGSWMFDSDKTHILITDSQNAVSSFEIIRLKDKELKLKTIGNGVEYVYFYVER